MGVESSFSFEKKMYFLGNRNGVVILDRKLYNNAIEQIISDTSKFEKLNKDPTLKGEASLQRFLRKLKQKIVSFWFYSCSYLWYS